MTFDGETFDPKLDGARLASQLGRVRRFLASGRFVTLAQIAVAARCSEASASARLRDLRKPRFGSYVVERRRVPGARGLFEYRLSRPRPEQLMLLTAASDLCGAPREAFQDAFERYTPFKVQQPQQANDANNLR